MTYATRPTQDPRHLAQMEEVREELLRVCDLLARRLRAVSPEEARKAALEVNDIRRAMRETSRYEVAATGEVLRLVEDALVGRG